MADSDHVQPEALLRLQSWLSPSFPSGAYSYSHGLEWAVEAGEVEDRLSLVDWLAADIRYGTGRNDAIFFSEAWRLTAGNDRRGLLEVARLAAAFRGTAELSLEASQQGRACLATLSQVWPGQVMTWVKNALREGRVEPTAAVILGSCTAEHAIPLVFAVTSYLLSYAANLISAGVRLVPLGQTEGQRAIAELEGTILAVGTAPNTIDELGSAAFMIDHASMKHETQYTRLFRS